MCAIAAENRVGARIRVSVGESLMPRIRPVGGNLSSVRESAATFANPDVRVQGPGVLECANHVFCRVSACPMIGRAEVFA